MDLGPYAKKNYHKEKKSKSKPKRSKTKVKTPRPEGEYKCVGCGNEHYLSRHHVWGKDARDFSSEYKCVEFCCWECHQSSYGIHGSKTPNYKLDYELKTKHEHRLLDEGMTRKEFKYLFGASIIEMDLEEYIIFRKKEIK